MNECHSIAQRGLNNELNFTFLDQLKIKFHKHYNIIQYPYMCTYRYITQYPYTCMCMYNTLIHVCVCTIPLYMYMYNTLIHVCICTIPLYMYVYVQYPYTCMCMYNTLIHVYVHNTLIHVCICTIPLYMYVYVQYPYTCMYNTLIHVCICTIPLYMYMYIIICVPISNGFNCHYILAYISIRIYPLHGDKPRLLLLICHRLVLIQTLYN